MNMTSFKYLARTAVATAAMLGAQFASAADVGAGSIIKLSTSGNGTLAGVFVGSVVSGPGTGSFQSFCLERYETFDPAKNLYVNSVSTATQNAPGSSNATQVSGGVSGSDPLSQQTAYLFTQFYNNNAAYAGNDSLANSFQRAVWFLEGEYGTDLTEYNADTQAKNWVADANLKVSGGLWSGLGNVRVLNLFKQDTSGNYTLHSQDQLYMVTSVPEPETYALMLAGLGLVGAVARRRSKVKTA